MIIPPHAHLLCYTIRQHIQLVSLDVDVNTAHKPELGYTANSEKPHSQSVDPSHSANSRRGGPELAAATHQIVTAVHIPIAQVEDLYSLAGLPILDTFVPDDRLPTELLVYDHDSITGVMWSGLDSVPHSDNPPCVRPVRYVRIHPVITPDLFVAWTPCVDIKSESDAAKSDTSDDVCHPPVDFRSEAEGAGNGGGSGRECRVAPLYLQHPKQLGVGGHSIVFRAPFTISEKSTVSVAAKTAHGVCGAHRMLDNEALMYHHLPRAFMHDTLPDSDSNTDGGAAPATVSAEHGTPSHDTGSVSASESEVRSTITLTTSESDMGASSEAPPAGGSPSQLAIVAEEDPGAEAGSDVDGGNTVPVCARRATRTDRLPATNPDRSRQRQGQEGTKSDPRARRRAQVLWILCPADSCPLGHSGCRRHGAHDCLHLQRVACERGLLGRRVIQVWQVADTHLAHRGVRWARGSQ